jgi:hypothetical protein
VSYELWAMSKKLSYQVAVMLAIKCSREAKPAFGHGKPCTYRKITCLMAPWSKLTAQS